MLHNSTMTFDSFEDAFDFTSLKNKVKLARAQGVTGHCTCTTRNCIARSHSHNALQMHHHCIAFMPSHATVHAVREPAAQNCRKHHYHAYAFIFTSLACTFHFITSLAFTTCTINKHLTSQHIQLTASWQEYAANACLPASFHTWHTCISHTMVTLLATVFTAHSAAYCKLYTA